MRPADPTTLLETLAAEATDAELEQLAYGWRPRPSQREPAGDWTTWLILAGRGFGKTRTGAETVRAWVASGRAKRVALVARTAADARDVMVEGESGILAVSPPSQRPRYEPSKRRLTWPNGAIATLYSADEPDLLRGPQHDGAWCDELAAWRYPDAWDQLQFGLRLGRAPRVVVTTTPRPTPVIRSLVSAPTTVVTRGSTYENRANLAPTFLAQIVRRYEGTRLGHQELGGVLLVDTPGALWTQALLDRARISAAILALPPMRKTVVALDPAVSTGAYADEFGIMVVGLGADGLGYVLEDASGKYSPDEWSRKALELYAAHDADAIVGEVNQGGDLVEHTVRVTARDMKARFRFVAVRATRGKAVRAEPAAALYEQGRVRHAGVFAELEDQMTTWDATDATQPSPDRVDALVWALTELFVLAPPPATYRVAPSGASRWRA